MATNGENHTSTREALPAKLAREARIQFTQFEHSDFKGYTWTHERSTYTGAKRDLVIYDADGKMSFVGREFNDRTFFWIPDAVSTGLALV